MTIAIAALILFALFGVIGNRIGAIRSFVGLIGLVVASAMAFPFAPMVAPLITKLLGVVNPLYNWFVPPATVFILINIVFGVLAFVVHSKIAWYFKYKATDLRYAAWLRLNARLGICVGVGVGAVYLMLLSMVVMAAGYLTQQLASSDPSKDPPALQWINRGRADITAVGMDRTLAALDPTPPEFYAGADLLGLLYHNPQAQNRLGNYPAILGLAERPEFKELGNDVQFNELLLTKPGLPEILAHPKVKAITANTEILQAIYALSPKDMLEFIKDGKSPLYDSEPVLGRWQVDVAATVRNGVLRNPKITAADQRRLKSDAESQAATTVTVTPEKKFIWRGTATSGISDWAGAAGRYTVSLDLTKVRQGKLNIRFDDVAIENGRLVVRSTADDFALVFSRVY